ncbi:hypothetical protein [uncultured Chryseobacterium sp.]|uniref:hypothetical protein n=1 Tax=uncultured Chryseobacterium sp. TaxID=259322 RepID=UPI0025FB9772|nr:hypothetical protein [uncultured Chryseobacterium sp.]
MKALTLCKIQSCIYLFIIIFSLQHFFFREFNYAFDGYEIMVSGIIGVSFISVLISVVILIRQGVVFINRKNIREIEMKYLVLNLVLYYGTLISSLCLSGEIRH